MKTQTKNQTELTTPGGAYQKVLRSSGGKLAHAGQPVEFRRKAVIFREGEAVEGIYFVHSGQAKLVKAIGFRRVQVLRFAKPGDWLGLRDLRYPAYDNSAIALTDMSASFLSRTELERMMDQEPQIVLSLLRDLGLELHQAEQRLCLNAGKTARQRVADTLLNLAETMGYTENRELNISLTMKDLASYTGTTNETFSRVMRDFQRLGLICKDGRKIQLLDPVRLSEIARKAGSSAPRQIFQQH